MTQTETVLNANQTSGAITRMTHLTVPKSAHQICIQTSQQDSVYHATQCGLVVNLAKVSIAVKAWLSAMEWTPLAKNNALLDTTVTTDGAINALTTARTAQAEILAIPAVLTSDWPLTVDVLALVMTPPNSSTSTELVLIVMLHAPHAIKTLLPVLTVLMDSL